MASDQAAKLDHDTLISVVVPAYNDEAEIKEFHRLLIDVAVYDRFSVEIV